MYTMYPNASIKICAYTHVRATSHTRLRHVTIALQALSLVEKVEPVQVRFTLHLRDQHIK